MIIFLSILGGLSGFIVLSFVAAVIWVYIENSNNRNPFE
jgi:hypothetical protein